MAFNKPVNYVLPTPSSRVMLSRQAALPLWADQTVLYLGIYQYGLITFDDSAEFDSPPATVASVPGTYTAFGSFRVTTSTLPGNPFPLGGQDSGTGSLPWIYLPAGGTFAAILAPQLAVTGGAGLSLVLDLWAAPGETAAAGNRPVIAMTFTGQNAIGSWSPTRNVWLRPNGALFTTAPTSGNTSMALYFTVTANYSPVITAVPPSIGLAPTPTLSTVFMPLAYPTEFNFSPIPWQSTRLTAVAALFTNVSQVLTKQGTALCARLGPDTFDVFNATVQDLSSVNPAEKQFLGLEHGAYTYAPPSTDLATFWDYANSDRSTQYPVYRLDNTSLVNNIIFSNPSQATNPCSLAVNLDWHIEFRTVSTLWQVGLSTCTLESLHQAQLALVSTGFFFNNEDHKANIRSIIHGITTYLGPIASAIHPLAGMLVGKARDLTVPSRPSAPKPTTLQIQTPRGRSNSVSSRRSRSGSRVRIMTKAQRKKLRKRQQQNA